MDLKSLSDEQLQVALKVIDSATQHGVNPDFVLPLVMVESGFDPKAKSPAGAIGPMQLMPIAAKDMKVDPYDLDQNIDGGMRLLRRLIDNKKLGGDPEKIIAAYNAGPNHKFFESGNPADLPDETVNHVVKVFSHFGDTAPEMTITEAPAQSAGSPERQASQTTGDDQSGNEDWRQNVTYDRYRNMTLPEQSAILGAVGHVAGAGLGLSKYPLAYAAKQIFDTPTEVPSTPEKAPPTSSEWKPSEPLKKPEQYAEEVATRSQQQRLSPSDKSVTGREAQTGYTEATGQQAARRKFQESIAKKLGLDINRPLAEFPELASTRAGVVAPQQTIDAMEAERLAEINRIKARAELAQKMGSQYQTMVQRGQTFKPAPPPPEPKPSLMSRYLSSFPGRMGAFGFGAGAMMPYAVEAYRAAKKKFGDESNIPGLAAVGVPTAGGLVSLKFPRLFGGATTALGLGYALTHPREVAESLSYSDINPTAFTGMPEEAQAPFAPSRGALPDR